MGETLRGPVFIVGSPRSGTSVLVDALLGIGYNGFREGNFLSLLWRIDDMVDRHFASFLSSSPQVLMSKVDKGKLKGDFFQIIANVVAGNVTDPWFDKSGNPEMIKSIPIIKRLWPTSVFIFAKRRGIENVMSRIKKFPAHTFEFHCVDWAKNMTAWRQTRGAIDPGDFIEIDQMDIAERPGELAKQLQDFLHCSDSAAQAAANIFMRNRPQQTAEGTAHRIVTLRTAGWEETDVELFMRYCGQEMRNFGYSYDGGYRLPS